MLESAHENHLKNIDPIPLEIVENVCEFFTMK